MSDWKTDFLREVALSTLPKKYRHLGGFDNYAILHPEHEAVKTAAMAWADAFSLDTKRGLSMLGTQGCGKSFLGCCVLQRLIERGFYSVMYETTADIAQDIQASWDNRERPSKADIVERLLEKDVLFLDDLGSEKAGDWFADDMFYLINSLDKAERILIVSTNCTAKELQARWPGQADRILSRIRGMCDSVGKFPSYDCRPNAKTQHHHEERESA